MLKKAELLMLVLALICLPASAEARGRSDFLNWFVDNDLSPALPEDQAAALNDWLEAEEGDWLANYLAAWYMDEPAAQEEYRLRADALFPREALEESGPEGLAVYDAAVENGAAALCAMYYVSEQDYCSLKPLLLYALENLFPHLVGFEAVWMLFDLSVYLEDSLLLAEAAMEDEEFYAAILPAACQYGDIFLDSGQGEEITADTAYSIQLDAHLLSALHEIRTGNPQAAIDLADACEKSMRSRSIISYEYALALDFIRAMAYHGLENDDAAVEAIKAYLADVETWRTFLEYNRQNFYLFADADDPHWVSQGLGAEMYKLASEMHCTDLAEYWYGLDGTWKDLLD